MPSAHGEWLAGHCPRRAAAAPGRRAHLDPQLRPRRRWSGAQTPQWSQTEPLPAAPGRPVTPKERHCAEPRSAHAGATAGRRGGGPDRHRRRWPSPTCRGGCRASGSPPGYFLDEVLEHGTEGCNYLLAVDVDMNTVDGYAMSSWERGYGDFAMRARPRHAAPGALARRAPRWSLADLAWHDGSRRWSPRPGRSCAASSTGSPSAAGRAYVGTELEFIVFQRHLRAGLGRAATAT